MTQAFKNIGIVGMGLMGGSIAKALKKEDPSCSIFSVKFAEEKVETAVDCVFEKYDELVAHSDLIVIATPLSCILEVAKKIKEAAPKTKKTIVIDIGSVKRDICKEFEALTEEHIEFLGTHPMAGKECSGFENSDPLLFQDASWILCPHAKNQVGTIEALSQWVQKLGAHSKILTPQEHDKKTALISHFPAILSQLLLAFVEEKDRSALEIAGPGFKSMTRLAKENPVLSREIAALNADYLKELRKEWLNFLIKEEEKL